MSQTLGCLQCNCHIINKISHTLTDNLHMLQACGCSVSGSTRLQCDAQTGRCTCQEGFLGDHCSSCSPGYYGFPRCQRCGCHLAGTVEARCDAAKGYCWCDDSGQCPCKVNRVLLIVAVKGWL